MPPDDSIPGASKKRRVDAHEVHRQTRKPQPLKVSAKNDIHRDLFCRPSSERYNDLAKNNLTKRKPDSIVRPPSQMPLQVREENECSVASCSVNFSEHSMNTDTQSVGVRNSFPDDAMSSCPSMLRQESDNVHGCDFKMDVHELELQAYQSTVRAFYALGPLTWEQESLLTNLRLSLNITNEEHLLQLRHLLSSWTIESSPISDKLRTEGYTSNGFRKNSVLFWARCISSSPSCRYLWSLLPPFSTFDGVVNIKTVVEILLVVYCISPNFCC